MSERVEGICVNVSYAPFHLSFDLPSHPLMIHSSHFDYGFDAEVFSVYSLVREATLHLSSLSYCWMTT